MWTTSQSSESASQRGRFLIAAVIISELMMLNVIFWARAQGSIEGLAAAVLWPWVAAAGATVLWDTRSRLRAFGIASVVRVPHRRNAWMGVGIAVLAMCGALASMA